jgi:CubicO group peptidase (beta-lactamase class C family)
MYITAGELIETVTGKSWGQNVQERILDPLGMDRTLWTLKDLESKGNYSTPHARSMDANYAIPWVSWDHVAATGGLISSVSDLSKWMIFNLTHGVHREDTLLTRQTRNMLWTPHNSRSVDHTRENDYGMHFRGYGLGWALSDFHGRLKVSHTGGYDGFITAVTLVPDENLGVVVLTNGVRSPIMAATYHALEAFMGVESGKDWSADLLESALERKKRDTRIPDRREQRQPNTRPTVPVQEFAGQYYSDLTGGITIELVGDSLRLEFEHQPLLAAKLTHWHHDVWEIHWEHPQAWFDFGTVQIRVDNNRKVTGLDFDVPNDDFFFEELKPYRIH